LDFFIKEKQFASQVVFLEISMQQQIFLQQMQMHMSAMEKHADTSEKYLWRIANFIIIHSSKRKRDGIDEEDNDSSNDDK
jgi:hypothetical protein